MCKHISELGHLQLTPGRHTAVLLRDGSRMVNIYYKMKYLFFINLKYVLCL